MRQFSSHMLGVDQGSVILFSDFEDDGPMWAGEGPRELRREVAFSGRFRHPPVVHVSMSMWDLDAKTNPRADIRADGITATGFTIVFRTWGDTRIARIRADWLALGELDDEDHWDVP
jgi:hypothetical protein